MHILVVNDFSFIGTIIALCIISTLSDKTLQLSIFEDFESDIPCDISPEDIQKSTVLSFLRDHSPQSAMENYIHFSKSCNTKVRTQDFKIHYNVNNCSWRTQHNHLQCLTKLNICYEFSYLSNNFSSQEASFKITPLLQEYLVSNLETLLIQFSVTSNLDAYWKFDSLVNQLVSLTIKRNGEILRVLPYPVDIFFKYSCKNVEPTNGRININLLRNNNVKESIHVYKLETTNRTGSMMVLVKFQRVKIHEEYMIFISRNIWPSHNTMISQSKKISTQESFYTFTLVNLTEEDNYYLGILPNAMRTLPPGTQVHYSFEVRYFQCLLKHGNEWSSDGCIVGDRTNEEVLHCQCRHLSLFGGHVGIPPRELDLISDIHLILDIKDNPRTFLLVCSLILTYLIVLVWTRHSDRKDRLQRNVVVLADNFPGESCPYLVTVFTGLWIGSGTDAKVALRLYGTKGLSRVHILQSHERKVLKQNCDDWFLIFTPKSLGGIEKIHLFHDHCGKSHDWYCSKIFVYDLKEEKDYKFIIEKWLSLKEVDECVEIYAYPTSTLKYLKKTKVIQENIIFGLCETHLLLSIFTRHPRSSVTRSQRLSICMCIVFMHLLTSIMFYEVEASNISPGISSHRRQIIISMESTFLATPFTFIVIFCFKKSRMAPPRRGGNVPMTLTAKMAVPLESGLKANQSSMLSPWHHSPSITDSSLSWSSNSLGSEEDLESEMEKEAEEKPGCWKEFCHQLQRSMFQVTMVKAMMPVRMAEEDYDARRLRRKWIFAAWFLCLTAIFGGGIFIILYDLKMDWKTSNEWMETSFLFSLANIFFMSPVKIIIFAIILALLYGQPLQYIPSYECDTNAALNKESMGNEHYLSKILMCRRRSCYRPLTNRENMLIRVRKSNWRRWRMVINFSVIILLYTVLTVEVLFHWHGLYLPTSQHILKMFDERRNITSFLSYYEYLSTVAVPILNKKYWYNGQSSMPHAIWKQEMGFTEDYMTRLMSRPFIRQQRVPKDSCMVSPLMERRFSHCFSSLPWLSAGDNKRYSANWSEPLKPENDTENYYNDNYDDEYAPVISVDDEDSPWIFSDSNSPLFICGIEASSD